VLLIDYDVLNPVAELKDVVARKKPSDLNTIDIMQRENKHPHPPLDKSMKMEGNVFSVQSISTVSTKALEALKRNRIYQC
jgi:hypothetical protein